MIERLLVSPYVRTPEKSLTSVACFQWTVQNEAHEFCPELSLHLSGTNREDVHRRMNAAIRERLAAGVRLGFTTLEKVATHLLEG
jgi:hypothetical protein